MQYKDVHTVDCDCKLGGTIGDIEGRPFIEAFSQFQYRIGPENFCCILVSLVVQVNHRVIFVELFHLICFTLLRHFLV